MVQDFTIKVNFLAIVNLNLNYLKILYKNQSDIHHG